MFQKKFLNIIYINLLLIIILTGCVKQNIKNNTIEPESSIISKTNNEEDIMNYSIISDYKNEAMAHCSMFVVNEGICYNVYYANRENVKETPEQVDTVVKLSIFDLCNPNDENIIEIARANTTYGEITLGNTAPYDPNIFLKDTTIFIYFRTLINNCFCYVYRMYNILSQTLSNVYRLYLKCDGENYDFNNFNVQTIHNSICFSSSNISNIMFSSHLVIYNGLIYGMITGYSDNFGGMLVKSTDGINWEVIKSFSIESNPSEADLYIKADMVYIILRAVGIYLLSYNLNSKEISKIIKLSNGDSRPELFEYKGNIYGIYPTNIKYNNIDRYQLEISMIRVDLYIERIKKFNCITAIHYPCVINYDGMLFMSFTTDTRKISLTNDRSNIGFTQICI